MRSYLSELSLFPCRVWVSALKVCFCVLALQPPRLSDPPFAPRADAPHIFTPRPLGTLLSPAFVVNTPFSQLHPDLQRFIIPAISLFLMFNVGLRCGHLQSLTRSRASDKPTKRGSVHCVRVSVSLLLVA